MTENIENNVETTSKTQVSSTEKEPEFDEYRVFPKLHVTEERRDQKICDQKINGDHQK